MKRENDGRRRMNTRNEKKNGESVDMGSYVMLMIMDGDDECEGDTDAGGLRDYSFHRRLEMKITTFFLQCGAPDDY
jgi:hypothetical protein